MKKIVALGCAAALVGGLFAAEPASNPSLVSFTGNASVEWGVDLDAGKTGFKNDTWTELKIKLFDAGDKSTSGEDIWAELVVKVDDDSSVGPNGYVDGSYKSKAAYIDVAKLHFNNIYVGIKSGDTQTGELDFTTAVRSADPWYHPGRWLTNVGPEKFTQGIVAGYADDNFDIGVDFRSLEDASTRYTNAYAFAAEAKLKDSNTFAEGLSVGLGASYNISDKYYTADKAVAATEAKHEWVFGDDDDNPATPDKWYDKVTPATDASGLDSAVIEHDKTGHIFGYSASVGYKFKIDDKYWLKPQVGLTGTYGISDYDGVKDTINTNTLAAAFIFAWGDTNSYGSTGGLYYFGDDPARGLTPGVSVLAYIPLASKATHVESNPSSTSITTSHDALKALIVPSFYSGDLIENLKVAAYSEIGLFNYRENGDPDPVVSGTTVTAETFGQTADLKNTMALAVAAGLKYDIKADDITVTPKASIRYANTCYVANKDAIDGVVPASDKGMFPLDGLGKQDTEKTGERAGYLAGDFFNLSAGVEVAGLINNTTFYGVYQSANLLNKTNYSNETIDNAPNANYSKFGMYNIKLGTFNVGCKISF